MLAFLLDTMFNCHPAQEQKKVDFLEHLYQKSGRDELPKGHPLRGTYTGLWQEFMRDNAEQARDLWCATR
jgi:hypothetical protein